MSTFITDTFTLSGAEVAGENITAHTGELGAHWTDTQGPTYGSAVLGATGRARLGGATGSFWYTQPAASGVPATADYDVQADLYLASAPTVHYSWGVIGRQTPDAQNFYQLNYDSVAGAWQLQKSVAGAMTVLATAAASFAVGATHTVKLLMHGTQISGQVDGLTLLGPVVDSAVSAAGAAAWFAFVDVGAGFVPGDGVGPQVDNFYGFDTAPDLVVDVSPSAVSLAPAGQQQFSATVVGSTNQAVSWSVQEPGGGAVSSGGLYTAPAGLGTFHVIATAQANALSTGAATVVVYAPTPPGAPRITLATAGGLDTITLPAASTLGTSGIAGYHLYAGPQSGFETDTGVFLTPSVFPASFAPQPTAPPGAATYYCVRAIDTAGLLSAPSNECWSRTTSLVASGVSAPRVFLAPYGSAASGLAASLGYTVYDYAGATLVPHTLGQTWEIGAGAGAGTGIYAALVDLDTAFEGVLVWDAPAGSGPYVEAFDAGPLAQVSGYLAGLDPATQVLQSPQHKLLTNAAGQVDVDWSEAIPAQASGLTLGRAALAAIAEGVGVWKYNKAAGTLNEYAEDGTTLLRSFVLTLDSSGTITERA